MPDYSKACIYKIKHKEDYDDDNVYIGATCNLIRRRNEHKSVCSNQNVVNHNLFLYHYIRNNGGWDQFVILKIHDYPCKSKAELDIEERRCIDLTKPKLNKIIPLRDLKQWYLDNIEKHKKNAKEWREKNDDKLKKKRADNSDELKEYQKIYRQNNKKEIAEKRKIYCEKNKEKNAEKKKEKITCDLCGLQLTKCHLKRHQRSSNCKK